jgi:hypothetical protein
MQRIDLPSSISILEHQGGVSNFSKLTFKIAINDSSSDESKFIRWYNYMELKTSVSLRAYLSSIPTLSLLNEIRIIRRIDSGTMFDVYLKKSAQVPTVAYIGSFDDEKMAMLTTESVLRSSDPIKAIRKYRTSLDTLTPFYTATMVSTFTTEKLLTLFHVSFNEFSRKYDLKSRPCQLFKTSTLIGSFVDEYQALECARQILYSNDSEAFIETERVAPSRPDDKADAIQVDMGQCIVSHEGDLADMDSLRFRVLRILGDNKVQQTWASFREARANVNFKGYVSEHKEIDLLGEIYFKYSKKGTIELCMKRSDGCSGKLYLGSFDDENSAIAIALEVYISEDPVEALIEIRKTRCAKRLTVGVNVANTSDKRLSKPFKDEQIRQLIRIRSYKDSSKLALFISKEGLGYMQLDPPFKKRHLGLFDNEHAAFEFARGLFSSDDASDLIKATSMTKTGSQRQKRSSVTVDNFESKKRHKEDVVVDNASKNTSIPLANVKNEGIDKKDSILDIIPTRIVKGEEKTEDDSIFQYALLTDRDHQGTLYLNIINSPQFPKIAKFVGIFQGRESALEAARRIIASEQHAVEIKLIKEELSSVIQK